MIVGVDVGGTFTDIVVYDTTRGIRIGKVSTTPKDPSQSIVEGLKTIVEDLSSIELIVHATTIGTNLFLGQVGLEPPPVVLFTNEGFRDILEIGRQNRPSLYNLYYDRPRPLVPRYRRRGIRGRIGPSGEELEPLDKEQLKWEVYFWCSRGVRVYAVSFLHSYLNSSHEEEAKRIIEEECPGSIVVVSHEVDPQLMEYERTSTTVVNAILRPVLSKYLERLVDELRREGFTGPLLVMQSNGGVSSVGEALYRPAAFIESGPSAGAIAASYLARLNRHKYALAFDMGGTTAKASSIIDGEPEVVDEYEVGGEIHMGRQVRGSGYPVRYPHIDLAEVSAGGGSITWVDPGGALRVGPLSAGADPGPACYGRGGEDPTITDANLLLGRLPEELAGGLKLRRGLAERAVREKVAGPLGLDLVEAAWAIIGVANTIMARALRLVTVERGHDPRLFTLYAFGGAGPLHAAELAVELGVRRVIIPPYAGVFSALGLLLADYRHSYHTPIMRPSRDISVEELNSIFSSLIEKAEKTLDREGVPAEGRIYRRYVDARYWGQAYTLRVPYNGSIEELVETFQSMHKARYGFSAPEEEIILTVARLEAFGVTRKPSITQRIEEGDPLVGEREVFFNGGWYSTPVFRRERLKSGTLLEGPIVIEAYDTTILIPPGWRASVLDDGSLSMESG